MKINLLFNDYQYELHHALIAILLIPGRQSEVLFKKEASQISTFL
jgi:hypothetical protein